MGRPPVIPAERMTRIVLSVLAGEMKIAEAARRLGESRSTAHRVMGQQQVLKGVSQKPSFDGGNFRLKSLRLLVLESACPGVSKWAVSGTLGPAAGPPGRGFGNEERRRRAGPLLDDRTALSFRLGTREHRAGPFKK